MTIQTIQYLKDKFVDGYIPVGADYTDLIDTLDTTPDTMQFVPVMPNTAGLGGLEVGVLVSGNGPHRLEGAGQLLNSFTFDPNQWYKLADVTQIPDLANFQGSPIVVNGLLTNFTSGPPVGEGAQLWNPVLVVIDAAGIWAQANGTLQPGWFIAFSTVLLLARTH